MEASQSPLDHILDEIASLSLDEQELLLNIVKKRHIERKREQILRDSRETMRAYKKGLAKTGTVEDLIKDLESD
jgi:DNA-binding NtrC family response regulator